MTEKDIDKYIAGVFQKHKIDFERIKNSNFKTKMKNFNTTAYSEPFPCDRWVSDFTFAHGGIVHKIENGLKTGNKLSNKHRKAMQLMRLEHWAKKGGVSFVIITSIDEARAYFKRVGIIT